MIQQARCFDLPHTCRVERLTACTGPDCLRRLTKCSVGIDSEQLIARGATRIIVYEFKARLVDPGIELGKVRVYRLNYDLGGASAIQIVTVPRRLPYCVSTEG